MNVLIPLLAFATLSASPPVDVPADGGATTLRSENTLPAFEEALLRGVTSLAFPVAVTSDGVAVVAGRRISAALCYGRDLEKGGPLVRDLTLAEVRLYDCGSRRPETDSSDWSAVPETRIPTLAEAFAVGDSDGPLIFHVTMDVDPDGVETPMRGEAVAAVLAPILARSFEDRVVVHSTEWETLALVRSRAPDIAIAARLPDVVRTGAPGLAEPVPGGGAGEWLRILSSADPRVDLVSMDWSLVDPRSPSFAGISPESLRGAGFPLVVRGVEGKRDVRRAVELGVSGIVSDDPEPVLETLRREGRRLRTGSWRRPGSPTGAVPAGR